ncbi:MAG: M20/M25/M40 family metallo-hydrolase [Deltaproteobacteria bacterium]|nr:M20/M25/M40 family metallo-hydrolase [Deltaproteobacteria bacterium]MBW1794114.1 M20/M25/M40 family metallo-hydrolase [Deltaproteobacteria bacterium]
MVNHERLGDLFRTLVRIDSVSKKEGAVAKTLQGIFESQGAEVLIDGAGPKVGSDTGNLIARFKGTRADVVPLLLNAHMDTVQPGEGVKVLFSDGTFTSDGSTILAADDKSALAVIIETIRILQKNRLPYGPLEVVVTICEEVGLLGAKNFDYSMIKAQYGYSLDGADTDGIVTRAPAANRIQFKVHGRDAHAGAAPEKGINAIHLASRAISEIRVGRIDEETTANIGLIEGGKATNIVPCLVTVAGEVRSHSPEKLEEETLRIVQSFERQVSNYKDRIHSDDRLPRLELEVRQDFSVLKVPEDHAVITLAKEAASNLGREMKTKTSGGGSDANIFFGQGIVTGVLGTGMKDIHTVRESIRLDDMVKSVELLLEIIQLHARKARQA